MSGEVDVLFVLPTLEIGGTERHVTTLAVALAARGHRVAVASLRSGGRLRDKLIGTPVSLLELDLTGVTDARAIPRLVALLRRRPPRTVHAFLHGFDALVTVAAGVVGVARVLGSRRELGWWMSDRHLLVQKIAAARVDGIICNSIAVRDDAVRRERGDPGLYEVIPGGVDGQRFQSTASEREAARATLGLTAGDQAIVTVANYGIEKGHATLVAAARAVVARLPRARFLVAGDGPERESIDGAAADLDGHWRALGEVADIGPLLAVADLFVLPSWSEGMPNALLEAMASGVPCIASDVGGVGEVVRHALDGWTVPARDPAVLATAIVRLSGSRETMQRLAESGRQRVLSEFSWSRCVARHEAAYGLSLP